MINNKVFEHRPVEELFAMVKREFSQFHSEGLIDEGSLIKTVMYCNEKLGLPIREVRERAIEVIDFKAKLPEDFLKLFYVTGLDCTSTTKYDTNIINAFDNNVDQDVVYKACLNRDQLGCVDNYQVVIERKGIPITYYHNQWTPLSLSRNSYVKCHMDCPNLRKPGKYEIDIRDGEILTPFKTGTLYMMYVGMMVDNEGNITYPFHPLITPYYEWSLKERIISNAIFESEGQNLGEKLKLAQSEKTKSWLDAFNFTMEREYGQFLEDQRKEELGWYNTYFKYFQ